MKKGILYFFIAAIAGAISACAVVKLSNRNTATDSSAVVQSDTQFKTVDLSNDKWPDFTFAAETCVDAGV